MSQQAPTIDKWIRQVEQAIVSLARDALGGATTQVVARDVELPSQPSGAYIPLINGKDSIQIGLVSDVWGCQVLAKALLQS